jgi:hypothetical protein
MTEPDPRWDDEGIPDVADDATPERGRVPDPQEAALPGERPQAVTDFGTTAEEQLAGEPLDRRLAREEPDLVPDEGGEGGPDPDDPQRIEGAADAQEVDEPGRQPAGRLVAPDEGVRQDTEKDLLATEAQGEAGRSPEERAMHVEEHMEE